MLRAKPLPIRPGRGIRCDGFGRAIAGLSEADITAGDEGDWVAGGLQNYDSKGAVRRKYLEFFYSGSPLAFPFTSEPPSPYGRQRYDAFGRQVQTFDVDGTVTLQSVYHALSTDLWDAADLENGRHHSTYASTRKDGHGRTIAATERFRANGVIERREVRTRYLHTGEPEVITRVRVGATDAPVVRWMRYDSLGRMVLNVEPNTTEGFTQTTRLRTPAASKPGVTLTTTQVISSEPAMRAAAARTFIMTEPDGCLQRTTSLMRRTIRRIRRPICQPSTGLKFRITTTVRRAFLRR